MTLPSIPVIFQRLRWAVVCTGLVGLGMMLASCAGGWKPSDPIPVISLPAEIHALPGDYAVIRAKSQGSVIKWKGDPRLEQFGEPLADRFATAFSAKEPGRYWICCWTATRGWWPWSAAIPSEPAHCVFIVDGPVPPIPPGPDPGPVPPVPPVPPSPAPIPVPGLRVLIVYETAELGKLPKEQVSIFNSTRLRDLLTARCVRNSATPEWRMYDKDADLKNESQLWRDAMARQRTKLPWILVSTGSAGFEGPLPATVDDTLALIQRFAPGGAK